MVGGTGADSPSAIFRIEARRILPERVFGSRCTTRASLNAATGPIRSRTSATSSAAISPVRAVHPRLQHDEADRGLPLQFVLGADHGALRHRGMRSQHLLHLSGGQPMAGDVDDVVGAAHHPDVALLVDHAGIAGTVPAREIRQIGGVKTLVVLPQGRRAARRQRQPGAEIAGLASREQMPIVIQRLQIVARTRPPA